MEIRTKDGTIWIGEDVPVKPGDFIRIGDAWYVVGPNGELELTGPFCKKER